jgi:hypothetical protein
VESIIRKLRIHTLKAQLALRRFVCETLAERLENGDLTVAEKLALARRWDDVMKEVHDLRLLLESQEQQGPQAD